MKRIILISAFFLLGGYFFSANAQDLIILRDGNVIEAKVIEISQTEIRYLRFNHLDGPVIVISRGDVLSIRYENMTVEIINPSPSAGQGGYQSGQSQFAQSDTSDFYSSGDATLLQQLLNRMPAIPIAGNNLKFDFTGETWTARVNGENFFAGTVEFEATADGGILTLRQTHIWPGAVGRTAGRVANLIPGGSAVGGALDTAGNIAGAAGAVEMSGPVFVLQFTAGPPASLTLISSTQGDSAASGSSAEKSANVKNNWFSVELALDGIGIRYERMLNSNVSLGLNYYHSIGISGWDYFEVNAFLRWYPAGRIFFLGLGLGYNSCTYGWQEYSYFDGSNYVYHRDYDTSAGFAIVPEIGWKIDVGNPGGFYIMPCLTFPFVFADPFFGVVRVAYFGVGFAF